jgi:hypothetical protein
MGFVSPFFLDFPPVIQPFFPTGFLGVFGKAPDFGAK